MLSVFGDESHDQTKKRVFVVAGLLGNVKDWRVLDNSGKIESEVSSFMQPIASPGMETLRRCQSLRD